MSGAVDYNRQINDKFTSICQPLLDKLGLTHFIYVNLLPDNKRLYLCNDVDWVGVYTNHKLHDDIKHENLVILPENKPECIFWECYGKTRVYDATQSHNISNGLLIYEGNEIFSFATKNENTNIVYSYMQNYQILKHFTLYFRSRAQDLIKIDNSDKLISTRSYKTSAIPSPDKDTKSIIKDMKIDKFYFDCADIHTYLSPRELEYLVHVAYGKSGKEVAWTLGISESTAETHMDHIKIKLGCHSKSQTIGLFFKSNLKHLSPENILDTIQRKHENGSYPSQKAL